jgi:hypothetical protein
MPGGRASFDLKFCVIGVLLLEGLYICETKNEWGFFFRAYLYLFIGGSMSFGRPH